MINKHVTLLSVAASAILISIMLYWAYLPEKVYAQASQTVNCGDIIENEFTTDYEHHIYVISVAPRDSLSISIEPVGDFLKAAIGLYGPTGIELRASGRDPGPAPWIESGVLSARGNYKIDVTNGGIQAPGSLWPGDKGGIGLYTLYIGCVKANGDVIDAGSSNLSTQTQSMEAGQTDSQANIEQESDLDTPLPFLTIEKSYEITIGSQTKIIKVLELRADGWISVEVNGNVGWLNLHQVALVIPFD